MNFHGEDLSILCESVRHIYYLKVAYICGSTDNRTHRVQRGGFGHVMVTTTTEGKLHGYRSVHEQLQIFCLTLESFANDYHHVVLSEFLIGVE